MSATKTNGTGKKNLELTEAELNILAALANAKNGLGRKRLCELGANARILGAGMKADFGRQGGGLLRRNLIERVNARKGERLRYKITPAGRVALAQATLTDLDNRIAQLSPEEQLRLVRRVAQRLAKTPGKGAAALKNDLDALAQDPAIRRELAIIEKEFAPTEQDGLENL
jgi:hypothetical protein